MTIQEQIFAKIAEALLVDYTSVYYVNAVTNEYYWYSVDAENHALKLEQGGDDFFRDIIRDCKKVICEEDQHIFIRDIQKENLLSGMQRGTMQSIDYRLVIDGAPTWHSLRLIRGLDDGMDYFVLGVMNIDAEYRQREAERELEQQKEIYDQSHFIICVENREKDVRREQEHLAALSMANEMARRDELTGTKNKTAYHEMEKELQRLAREGSEPFGIVICDINGLKTVNDTEGHRAGDDYIRAACKLICRVFHHSPVFRIGGDEFAVILRGQDYANRERLVSGLRKQVEENIRIGEGPVVASGLAEYMPGEDQSVADVFNRADTHMYGDKTRLKEQKLLQESHSLKEKANVRVISEERRIKLDTLFKAFEVVSEGTYVYLCDMKYDFSRWSKNAVDTFGLPSEYMYGAGDIWENQIHPDDRAAYHKGIDDIFSGNAAGHDMQYRARRLMGEYDVCTCRGVVIRDHMGEPDYFVGTIRNHGIQGHIDTLTGLRNQYGFFEDLDGCIKRNTEISVALFGISRFSEINEMHGYHFGNRVLQSYARCAYEATANTGHVYRIDGTKFAIISNTLSIAELREQYRRFRAFLHEDFKVDGTNVLLDLNCGALRVDSFDIDSQTIYACLNFAYDESKFRRKGDMVTFRDALNDESHQRLEKLHAIRASIMRGYEGFYLLYQPVVDASTEKMIGAEALLRWKNDVYGMVPPDQFIPVLESDPLFPALGEWIIREAILAARQILKRCPAFVVNVNLSYTQMEQPGFVDMVLRILNELDYPPEHLCLEVTERCRLLDMELLKNVVVNLKSRGILIALDDFGTGFSAVGIIKEVPFDIIKIDRGFVMTVEESETDRRLIGNIADLAGIYGSKVCVEGIETAGMRDILRRFRVGSFQGYYYAKPLPLDGILAWRMDAPRG